MYFPGSRSCFLRLPMPFVPVPRGFGRAPRGTAVPLSSGSDRGLGRIETPQRSLGTFRRWKVPRRRLLQKRFERRVGIRFAYLVRFPLPIRAWQFPEPTVPTPHFLFVPPKRKRAVDGTKEKGGRGSRQRMVRPPPAPPAERSSDGYAATSLTATTIKVQKPPRYSEWFC